MSNADGQLQGNEMDSFGAIAMIRKTWNRTFRQTELTAISGIARVR